MPGRLSGSTSTVARRGQILTIVSSSDEARVTVYEYSNPGIACRNCIKKPYDAAADPHGQKILGEILCIPEFDHTPYERYIISKIEDISNDRQRQNRIVHFSLVLFKQNYCFMRPA